MADPGARDEPDHRPGLEHEPHLRGGPSPGRGQERLDFDANLRATLETDDESSRSVPLRATPREESDEPVEHSAADEPALGWAEVDRSQVPGYREHLVQQIAATGPLRVAVTVVLLALAAGPFAILGAIMEGMADALGSAGYLAIVVFGPVAEEMMKVAAVLWTVERKPWLLPGSLSIVLVGLCGGLGFAAIENLMYLNVYFPDPSPGLVRWRWTICVAMHVACSTIAAVGIARMWRTAMRTGRPAQTAQAFPFLLTAMIVHGAYNALAVALSMFGLTPE